MTSPALTLVTIPVVASTVAMASSLEAKVPPVVPSVETVDVSPTAKVVAVAERVPADNSVMVKRTSSVIEQDNSSVSVNVYVKSTVVEDVGVAIVASLKEVVGDHEKVTPFPVYVPFKVPSTPVQVEASG